MLLRSLAWVQQLYMDYLSNPSAPEFANVDPAIQSMPRSKSLLDKACEKTFVGLSSSLYKGAVWPSTQCLRRLGNMYTAAVYGALASIVDAVEPTQLQGKKIALFSFGSGLAASFFTIRVKGDTSRIRDTLKLNERLAAVAVRPPQDFIDALKVRLSHHITSHHICLEAARVAWYVRLTLPQTGVLLIAPAPRREA